MGVKATLVFSVVVSDPAPRSVARRGGRSAPDAAATKPKEKLWGLIVCHHYQGPHRVPYYQRSAAEFLVRIFALQARPLH